MPMDATTNWSELLLSEEGPTMSLPRRTVQPRNVDTSAAHAADWVRRIRPPRSTSCFGFASRR